jgi:predicted ABC-class ATPase
MNKNTAMITIVWCMSALEITLWKVSNLQYLLRRVDQLVLNKDK